MTDEAIDVLMASSRRDEWINPVSFREVVTTLRERIAAAQADVAYYKECADGNGRRVSELEAQLAAYDTSGWSDKPLPEDAQIKAEHPVRTGNHDVWVEAMRLVGACHSKYRLVELVNWLLVRAKSG